MFDPRPGQRVVIRYTVDGVTTDALGEVAEASADSVVVVTKAGRTSIARNTIDMGHEIPPAPTRTGPLHEVVSVEDLRKISAAAWLPPTSAWLHQDNVRAELEDTHAAVSTGWLLRASDPACGRQANSALVLDSTGFELEQAFKTSLTWYERLGTEPAFQVFSKAQSHELAAESSRLAPLLRPAGFTPADTTLALTVATAQAASGAQMPSGLQIVHSEAPHARHLSAWGHTPETPEAQAYTDLITSPDRFTLLSAIAAHPDGSRSLVGVVRLAIVMKWAVVSNLIVDPSLRRRGAGRALVQAAARLAQAQGIRSLMAEVVEDNAASLRLFHSLGASEHHRCWFARRQSGVTDTSPY